MNVQINIDTASCIRCGKCVKVCPAWIMTQAKPGDPIGLRNIDSCIVCGHCAAVCPTGSVRHSSFPPDKIHPIDRNGLPSPEQVLLLCKARRSNRALSDRPVPQEAIDRILEAAHRAPTGSELHRHHRSRNSGQDHPLHAGYFRGNRPQIGKPVRQAVAQTPASGAICLPAGIPASDRRIRQRQRPHPARSQNPDSHSHSIRKPFRSRRCQPGLSERFADGRKPRCQPDLHGLRPFGAGTGQKMQIFEIHRHTRKGTCRNGARNAAVPLSQLHRQKTDRNKQDLIPKDLSRFFSTKYRLGRDPCGKISSSNP